MELSLIAYPYVRQRKYKNTLGAPVQWEDSLESFMKVARATKIFMVAFTYIDNDKQLAPLISLWLEQKDIAIDLEMEANLHHYGTYLSLVQVGLRDKVWVVDMLGIQDASPIMRFFENPRVQKVFHDVSFDFKTLEELYDCRPKNIFDTKIAALLTARKSISLAGLLEEEFNVKKQSKFQKADWYKRPLSKEMLDYAASDVIYLLRLKDNLERQLIALKRDGWMKEECAHIETVSYASPVRTYQDIKGSRSLSPLERGRLQALFIEREKVAEHLDKPVFFIIPDRIMLELAKQPPKHYGEWQAIRGIHPAVKRKTKQFMQALQQAKPLAKKPQSKLHISFAQREEIDKLFEKRKAVAERLGIEPYLLFSKEQCERYVVNGLQDAYPREWQKRVLSL